MCYSFFNIQETSFSFCSMSGTTFWPNLSFMNTEILGSVLETGAIEGKYQESLKMWYSKIELVGFPQDKEWQFGGSWVQLPFLCF